MVKIQIGSSGERTLEQADESWINEQVNRRRDAAQGICVRVRIITNSLNMELVTPECGMVGRGRQAYPGERPILDLWQQQRLDQPSFSSGNLIAFLKQLKRLL